MSTVIYVTVITTTPATSTTTVIRAATTAASAAAAAKLRQSCPTLCDPRDGSPPGSRVPGILQARILEWVAMPSSKRSSRLRIELEPPALAGRFFTIEPPGSPKHLI